MRPALQTPGRGCDVALTDGLGSPGTQRVVRSDGENPLSGVPVGRTGGGRVSQVGLSPYCHWGGVPPGRRRSSSQELLRERPGDSSAYEIGVLRGISPDASGSPVVLGTRRRQVWVDSGTGYPTFYLPLVTKEGRAGRCVLTKETSKTFSKIRKEFFHAAPNTTPKTRRKRKFVPSLQGEVSVGDATGHQRVIFYFSRKGFLDFCP